VTPEDLWKRVGAILTLEREKKGWKNVVDVHRFGGRAAPTNKTIGSQEEGHIQTIDGLERHVSALGLSLVDVLRSALSDAEKPITPDALRLLRMFERLGPGQQSALLRIAEELASKTPEGGNR